MGFMKRATDFLLKDKQSWHMIKKCFIDLSVIYQGMLDAGIELPERIHENIKRIQGILDDCKRADNEIEFSICGLGWSDIHQLEQDLIGCANEQFLRIEFNRELIQYRKDGCQKTADYYSQEFESDSTDLQGKRTIVLRLLQDRHRYHVNKIEEREYSILIRVRTLFVFLVSVVLFGLILIAGEFLTESGLVKHAAVLMAAGAGFMGASFSVLTSLKDHSSGTLDDLKVNHRFIYILKRPMIGVGASVILYFMMWAYGQPPVLVEHIDYSTISDEKSKELYVTFSVIIVSGFIAGFSEKLVPKLLTNTASKS